ncbi:hypothetical protein KGF56_000805 [Candida oxycetoniae]|uniref:Sedoheptulose 1,7-bisphosphatase n=1 Tax=Candida oxycetoniae TaxID=497107 RepID=A0AAI9WZR0_9ASCO|nr:uncharacterized protein KGF56_000805 [Candida oxycetoniae]KAI3406324.2 hypothetical protein KGF56_000805 [Candida oxycetoniae]
MTHKPSCRVIFVRHGQTEWSKSGQYTSTTNLDLTPFGVKQMRATGKSLIGHDPLNMINPKNITHVFTSPRSRAILTTQALLEHIHQELTAPVLLDDDLAEWRYGEYEGMKTDEIRKSRKDRGIDAPDHRWTIWEDGCEGGEDYKDVTKRLDRFISRILEIHGKYLKESEPSDILVVAHGHILRCLVARWVHRELNKDPQLILDAGGVGVLSYQHNNIEEPAIYLAGAFTIPVHEMGEDV